MNEASTAPLNNLNGMQRFTIRTYSLDYAISLGLVHYDFFWLVAVLHRRLHFGHKLIKCHWSMINAWQYKSRVPEKFLTQIFLGGEVKVFYCVPRTNDGANISFHFLVFPFFIVLSFFVVVVVLVLLLSLLWHEMKNANKVDVIVIIILCISMKSNIWSRIIQLHWFTTMYRGNKFNVRHTYTWYCHSS